ncbi:MAG: hypothetical protein ACYCVL_11255 [Gemmatimonadaceae bacterium]
MIAPTRTDRDRVAGSGRGRPNGARARRMARACLVVLVAAAVGACARVVQLAGGPSTDLALIDPDSSTVTFAIDNRNWTDVVVWLAHDGLKSRLGTIRSANVQTFQVPTAWTGRSRALQLVAHAIGAPDDFTSETFSVQLGQTVTWMLQVELSRSSLSIR